MRARNRLLLSALAMLSLLLGSCAEPDVAPGNASEVEETLVSLMTDSAAQLPVGKWEPVGGRPAPGPCPEDNRARFSWSISAPRGADPLMDAKRIASYWSGLGMRARLVEAPIPSVFATGGSVQGLSFVTGPSLYAVHGTSLCAEGDSADLEDRPTVPPRTPLPEASPMSHEHPADPMNLIFGAHACGTDSGRGELAAIGSHGTTTPRGVGYLHQYTESLRDIAMATIVQGDALTPARGWISENLR